ncbi:MAG: AAA family ATPase, partial [Promethearchaeota archaeon]
KLEGIDALEESAAKLDPLKERKDALISKKAALEQELKSIEASEQDFEERRCPFTKKMCPVADEVQDFLSKDSSELEESIKELEGQLKGITGEIQEAETAARQLASLKGEKTRLDELKERFDRVSDDLAELGRKMKDVSDLKAGVKALKKYLDDHQGEYAEYTSLSTRELDSRTVEREVNELVELIEEKTKKIEKIRDSILAAEERGNTEATLEGLKKQQRGLEGAYKQFERNLKLIESIPEKEKALEAVKEKIEATRGELESLKNEMAVLTREFDDAILKREKESLERTRTKHDALRGELKSLKQQASDLAAEVKRLLEKRRQLRDWEGNHETARGDLEFFDVMREAIGKLANIRTIYIEKIIKSASAIWKRLTGSNWSLQLSSSYAIYKMKREKVISLFEMSGGERVAACLVVRLAIQRVIGGFGTFILDEPTIHLDEDTRRSLAQRIAGIKEISQLIVVSHDDTFENYAEQRVKLVKSNDETKVEVDS